MSSFYIDQNFCCTIQNFGLLTPIGVNKGLTAHKVLAPFITKLNLNRLPYK